MTTILPPLLFKIDLPDGPQTTEYYVPIVVRVAITNISTRVLIIDRVALRFQADYEAGSNTVIVMCNHRVAPGSVVEEFMEVTPPAHYVQYTNAFGIRLSFHDDASRPDHLSEEKQTPAGAYILLKEPRPSLGRVFISFKEPEDLALKSRMETLLRRAGFSPWTARSDARTGRNVWKEIEEAIRSSTAVVFVWTENTSWTDGVAKEVTLCRTHGIPEIALLERRLPTPAQYHGSEVHWERFDLETPTDAFLKVVQGLRDEHL